MAKLSAHGIAILRIEHESTHADADNMLEWSRITRAYFADGIVLAKRDVRFKPDSFSTLPRAHSYGWKRRGRFAPSSFSVSKAQAIEREALAKGWRVIESASRH